MTFEDAEILMTLKDRALWLVGQVPEGEVATYGQIALLAGSPGAARAVGNALRSSGLDVPWQRIINASGAISFKGDVMRAELQRELLVAEGVEFTGWKCALKTYVWCPDDVFWAAVDAPR